MNREHHLQKSLPAWLSLPAISEVVIVDWSNSRPLTDLTSIDTRIRVIRVENEPKWILSYAYNLGVRSTQGDTVLKCDADCLPSPTVPALQPDSHSFFAGNWRTGKPIGKPSVNGQCVFSRSQFNQVNGYSEFIRTYGRDDEDFYERLQTSGFDRKEISPRDLDFIDHDQDARMANQFAPRSDGGIEQIILRDPVYNELRNIHFAQALPWGPQRLGATYATTDRGDRWSVLRRNKSTELAIPAQVDRDARLRALRTLTSSVVGLPSTSALKLTEDACIKLLANRMISKEKRG